MSTVAQRFLPRRIGAAYALESTRAGWSQSLGDYTEQVYCGWDSALQSLMASYRGNCSEVFMEGKSRFARLTVRLAADNTLTEETQLQVKLQVNRAHKSIFEPPAPADVTNAELRLIKKAIDQGIPAGAPGAVFESDIEPITLENPNALALYELVLHGLEFRIVHQPVIIVSRTGSSKFDWGVGRYDNVGRIHTWAQMLNDAGIPEPNFEQPPLQAAQTGYVPGWLKHTPSYESVAGGRSSEVIEYEGGLWPTFLYPPA